MKMSSLNEGIEVDLIMFQMLLTDLQFIDLCQVTPRDPVRQTGCCPVSALSLVCDKLTGSVLLLHGWGEDGDVGPSTEADTRSIDPFSKCLRLSVLLVHALSPAAG